jgi:hypothetical protein
LTAQAPVSAAIPGRGRRHRAGIGWDASVWLAFTAYLLTPTALRVWLDGVPLNTRAELAGFALVSIVAGGALLAWSLRLRDDPDRPGVAGHRGSRVVPLAIVTTLLLGLSGLKAVFPSRDGLSLCLRSPEVDTAGCLWSPEGPGHASVTRYEARLWFDEAAGRSWRLGYLNDVTRFNLHRERPDTREGRRQRFRSERANPFEASGEVPPPVVALLSRDFVDGAGLVWLSGRTRGALLVRSADGEDRYASGSDLGALETFRFAVPRADLAGLGWRYRNYDCPDGALEECARDMTFRTLPLRDAVLDVRVLRPGTSESVHLGLGQLLWASRAPPAVLARVLEALALVLFAGVAIAWPVGRAVAARLGAAIRGLDRLEALAVPAAAVGLAALLYRVAIGPPVSAHRYATLFDPATSLWLTLPGVALLLLLAARPRWRARLGPAAGPSSRSGFLLWLLPFAGYAVLQIARHAPATDEATPLWPGDDNLTYSSRGKEVLRAHTLDRAYDGITKSAFPYLRAAGYLVLGEGERYTSVAIGAAFLVIYGVVAYCAWQTCRSAVERGGTSLRAATVVLYPTMLVWLANALLSYGATFAAYLFSEGPAWAAFMLAVALVLRATAAHLDRRLAIAAGVTFAVAVLCRLPLVTFAPLLLAALLTRASTRGPEMATALRAILLPLLGVLGLIALQGTVIGAWSRTVWYVGANTSLRPGMTLRSVFGAGADKLVPNREAWIQIVVFGALYLLVVGHERRRSGGWASGPVLRLLGFGGALLLCGFLLQVPMLPAPYYPRTIMPTYFFLIAFLPLWLARLAAPPGAGEGGQPSRRRIEPAAAVP